VGVFANFATRAQMAVRTEGGACPDHGMFKYAAGLDQYFISDFAAQVLGLSHASSLLLFDGRNTIETIKQMRDLIAYGFDNLYRRWHNLDNLDEVKYRESRISQFTNNS